MFNRGRQQRFYTFATQMYTIARNERLAGLLGHKSHALHKSELISLAEYCDGVVNNVDLEVNARVDQLGAGYKKTIPYSRRV